MKDADIPTIFNPRRVRTPSVVITEEESSRNVANGPFNNSSNVQQTDSGEQSLQSLGENTSTAILPKAG